MRYLTAVDFILETLCLLCMFCFVLGNSITPKKLPRIISILFGMFFLAYILSDAFDGYIIILTFICLLPLFIKHILYYTSWFMVYNLGYNIISTIAQLAAFTISHDSYLSTPSSLPFYAAMDDIILTGLLIFFFSIRKRRRKRREIIECLQTKDYVLLLCTCLLDFIILIIAASFFTAAYFSYPLNEKGKFLFSFALLVLIFLSIIIFYLFCSTLRKNIMLQEINKLNTKNLALEQKYYEILHQKNQDLRAFRHDFQSHVLALNTYAQGKNWGELAQYLSDLTATKEQISYFSTNSTLADAIVNEFYQALPENISFHMEGQFPHDMQIADMDISIILSNLLKNAVEACERLHQEAEKEILLEIQCKDRQLLIRMENSSSEYSPEEIQDIETSKKDTINHGFGLNNIYESVKKYHGTMDIQYQNGYFMVMLILERGQSAQKGMAL